MRTRFECFARGRAAVAAALVAALLAGCAGTEVREKSSQEWFEEGQAFAARERYSSAVEAFREAAKGYRGADLDADIQIALSDALFAGEEYPDAVVAYADFLRLHPHNSRSDWAQYRIGLAWMEQMRGPDRGQEPARAAVSAFDALLRGYPRSSWIEEALKRRDESRRALAEHELYVGEFYLRTGSYQAAVGRYEVVMKDFAGLGFGDIALYQLGRCYEKLRQEEKAAQLFDQLRREYPGSRFIRELDSGKG